MPAPVLLTDTQIQDYLTHGYVVLRSGHPAAFHRRVLHQVETLYATAGNPGNDILPRVPDLYGILRDPAVDGALRGLLGADYLLHPHRHCHENARGSGRPGDAPGQLRERPQRAPPSHPVGDGVLLPAGCPPGDGADRHPAGQPVLRIRRAGAAARGVGAVRCGRYRDHRPLRPVAPRHGQHRRPPPLHGQVPVHPHERAACGHVGPSRRGIRPGRG